MACTQGAAVVRLGTPATFRALIGIYEDHDPATWLGCIMYAARPLIIGAHVLQVLDGLEFTYTAVLPGRIKAIEITGEIRV